MYEKKVKMIIKNKNKKIEKEKIKNFFELKSIYQ
jgi:hypothetical protein